MNTYDPAAHIRYVHLAREGDPHATPVETGMRSCTLTWVLPGWWFSTVIS